MHFVSVLLKSCLTIIYWGNITVKQCITLIIIYNIIKHYSLCTGFLWNEGSLLLSICSLKNKNSKSSFEFTQYCPNVTIQLYKHYLLFVEFYFFCSTVLVLKIYTSVGLFNWFFPSIIIYLILTIYCKFYHCLFLLLFFFF